MGIAKRLRVQQVAVLTDLRRGMQSGTRVVEIDVPVLVQFGGQTPLNLARALKEYGVSIWGTPPEAIALAEDREQFAAILRELDIPQPENGTAMSLDEAGRLRDLKQDGWHVSYERYQVEGNYQLPGKMTLENPQLKVKLVISDWVVPA